jgi:hypothetical protein
MGEIQGLIDLVYRAENGGRIDYDVIYGKIRPEDRPAKPMTQMSVREVLAWQDRIDARYASEAAGAVQIIPDTLRAVVRAGGRHEWRAVDRHQNHRVTSDLDRFFRVAGVLDEFRRCIVHDQLAAKPARERHPLTINLAARLLPGRIAAAVPSGRATISAAPNADKASVTETPKARNIS